ncbi:MAG: 5-carboxymethyl-2-hydroxymuconate isomerase [Pseudomonadota bacterium]|nr:5-carboxymethyl-2-hydroxymuconate isomerase [Pseudomonadota bacterium]
MPQIRVEFSQGSISPGAARDLAFALHHALAPVLETDLPSFKTRLVCLEDFAIGGGPSSEGMIHVELGVLAGRSDEVKGRAAGLALATAQACLAREETGSSLQLTVEVRDMDRSSYRKFVRTGQ